MGGVSEIAFNRPSEVMKPVRARKAFAACECPREFERRRSWLEGPADVPLVSVRSSEGLGLVGRPLSVSVSPSAMDGCAVLGVKRPRAIAVLL